MSHERTCWFKSSRAHVTEHENTLIQALYEGRASLGGVADALSVSHPEVEEMLREWISSHAKKRL